MTAPQRQRVFLACMLLLAAPMCAETIDRVLAVVAGQLITLSDVTAARDLGLEEVTGGADPVRAILTRLEDRQLMLAEVDRYAPPEPTSDAVDRELAAVRARFAGEQAFTDVLARSGLDVTHLRERLREDLRIRAYLDQRFGSDDRRPALVEDWLSGLRRRGNITDLYVPTP
jgi:hypothetical protein